MPRVVSLLRGINVGGARPIKMPALRDLYAQLGFTDVETYVQSGNVVFDTDDELGSTASRIENAIAETFGHDDVDVILVDADAMRRIVDANPYSEEAASDPTKVHVAFFVASPEPTTYEELAEKFSPEHLTVGGDGVIYLLLPDGIGRSKLAAALTRRKGPPMTVRNWRTTLTLLNMVEA